MKPGDISKETIEDVYWKQCLSMKQASKKIGCSKRTLFLRMKELNIPRRTLSESKTGHLNYNYSGGPKCNEHIRTIEKTGKKIEPNNIVHHINGDHTDNRPENLFLCKDSEEHRQIHRQAKELAKSYGFHSGEMEPYINLGAIVFDEEIRKYKVVSNELYKKELPSYKIDKFNPDFIEYLYFKCKYNLREIGLMFNLHPETVRKKMKRWGIKTRLYGSWVRGRFP